MERKWWTLIAVCVATFMLLLDITVVNTALPSIRRDLHSSFTDLQWVVDAYALTLAAFVLTSGSRSARRRRAHPGDRLAVDLLPEHPGRHRRDRRDGAEDRRIAR